MSATKHMHYCIQNIYHVYYTTQWNFIILRTFSHMTLTMSATLIHFSFGDVRVM